MPKSVKEEIDECVQSLKTIFGDGFQWKDIPEAVGVLMETVDDLYDGPTKREIVEGAMDVFLQLLPMGVAAKALVRPMIEYTIELTHGDWGINKAPKEAE